MFSEGAKTGQSGRGIMNKIESFLSSYISTISELNSIDIGCWDAKLSPLIPPPARIESCEQYRLLLPHVLKSNKALSYSGKYDGAKHTVSIFPIIENDIKLLIVFAGKSEETNLAIGESLKALVSGISQTFLGMPKPSDEDKSAKLIAKLLMDQPDRSSITKLSKHLEWDNALSHSVLVFKLQRNGSGYFNINLDLGYTSSEEKIKESVISKIKHNKYLSSQDLVSSYLDNYIIVIKSLYSENGDRENYEIVQKIMSSIMKSLEDFPTLFFIGSFGTIKTDFLHLRESFLEATNLISRKDYDTEENLLISPEDVLIETVFGHLEPPFTAIYLESLAEILKTEDSENPWELLQIAEAYVDNSMNYSQTSKKINLHRNTVNMKVEKFIEITSLNPQKSFRDALTIKLLSLHTQKSDRLNKS